MHQITIHPINTTNDSDNDSNDYSLEEEEASKFIMPRKISYSGRFFLVTLLAGEGFWLDFGDNYLVYAFHLERKDTAL